ncbi:MAG: hypothetical protein WCL27_18485, partial [Betaproteobacteria bacterium]
MDKQKSWILAHSKPVIERLQRQRWAVTGVGSFALLGMMTAFALTPSGSEEKLSLQTVLEQLATPNPTLIETGNGSFLREERILRSDTISSLTSRLGISDPEALDFIRKTPET